MFVKPKIGLVVRDPVSKRPLAAEGGEVAQSGYWMRRLRDGDVVMAEIAAPAAPSSVTPSPKAAAEKN